MTNYEKPRVIVNADLAENVYTASGDGGDCYTVSAYIHQTPEEGRETYTIQVNAVHNAGDGHHSGQQTLILYFNQAVTYVWSNGTLVGGDGTSELQIDYQYHSEVTDNIGLGDIYVESASGLAVNGGKLLCNHDCGQH